MTKETGPGNPRVRSSFRPYSRFFRLVSIVVDQIGEAAILGEWSYRRVISTP